MGWLVMVALAAPGDLRCEWRTSGAVVADPCPEFWWAATDQAAYRVQVATVTEQLTAPDAWDSGWVPGDLNLAEYAGRPLRPGVYHYRVGLRDARGAESWSPAASFTYQPVELPRRFPTIRTFLHFGAPLEVLLSRYDACYSAEANAKRPEIVSYNYSLLATLVVPSDKHDQLAAYCLREGLTREGVLEAMFLHYGEDTEVRLHVGREAADQPIEERTVPGWDARNDRDGDGRLSDAEAAAPVNPKATARTPREARVPIYYWGPPRDDFVMYPGQRDYQRYLATVYAPSRRAGFDGLMVDTTPPTPPGPAGGRVLAEYRQDGADGWRRDMLRMLAAIKIAWPEVPILGNGWETTPYVMDGMGRENWLDLRATAAGVRGAVREARELDRRGKIQWLQYNHIAVGDEPTFAPRLPVSLARDQEYAVAAYLLAAGERTYFGYGRHPYGSSWKILPACVSLDLGRPTGELTDQPLARPGTPDSPNLLVNGDFEQPPTAADPLPGWQRAEPFEVAAEGRGGGRCLKMVSASSATNNINKQYVKLKPDTLYTVSGWYRADHLTGGAAHCYVYEFDGAQLPPADRAAAVHGTCDWTPFEFSFRTGRDTEGRLNLRIMHATGTAWFDDVALREGDHTTAWLFRREFERGLVLLRPNGASDFGDRTALPIELPGRYRRIRADGKVNEAVDHLTLREGEAALLLKP